MVSSTKFNSNLLSFYGITSIPTEISTNTSLHPDTTEKLDARIQEMMVNKDMKIGNRIKITSKKSDDNWEQDRGQILNPKCANLFRS